MGDKPVIADPGAKVPVKLPCGLNNLGYKYSTKDVKRTYQIFTFRGKQNGKTAAQKTAEKKQAAVHSAKFRAKKNAHSKVKGIHKSRKKRKCKCDDCKIREVINGKTPTRADATANVRGGPRAGNTGSVLAVGTCESKLKIKCKKAEGKKKKIKY